MKSAWLPNVLTGLILTLLTASGHGAAPTSLSDVDGPLGLVRVSGGGYREARDLARRLESVFHTLEEMTGLELDRAVKPYVRLVLPASDWGTPAVEAVPSSNGLPWHLTVTGPAAESMADLDAYLARLVLSLGAGERGRPLGRGDWLAVGLAGNLTATDKAKNRELVRLLIEEGRLPSLDVIASWNRMPDGPMMEKAAAAQAVAWLLAAPPESGGLSALVRQLGLEPVSGDALKRFRRRPGRDPEEEWRAFAGAGDVLVGGIRPLTPDRFARFRDALRTPAAELGLAGEGGPDALSPYQLLAIRGARGVREAARARAEAVQKWAVGSPPELAACALAYKRFFDGLAGRTFGFLLRRRLAAAERTLRRAEDETALRSEWVDRFDRDAAGDPTERLFEESERGAAPEQGARDGG